jgi:hypothetical protein
MLDNINTLLKYFVIIIIIMMDMMKMTAMDSLYDKPMLYLDLVSGVGGATLYALVQNGLKNFKITTIPFKAILGVLIARILVDYFYSTFISSKSIFGGSNQEFLYSSIVWFLLMSVLFSFPQSILLYGCTLLVMMATARLTHWG